MEKTTTVTAIIGNGAWILRLVNGPHLRLEQIQKHFPDAKHTLPFFFNEYGDCLAQYAINSEDAMKYRFNHLQQFTFQTEEVTA